MTFRIFTVPAIFVAAMLVHGCATPVDADPVATLNSPYSTHRQQLRAIHAVTASDDPAASIDALEQVVRRDGFTPDVREAALNRLAEFDIDRAKRIVRQHLPRTGAWGWIQRVCEIIPERGWHDLSPALVSSWARPSIYVNNELDRPEYQALAKLHGEVRVTDIVYQTFVDSDDVGMHGLRTRCWDLLHRLGQRERLVQLIDSSDVPSDDALLIDLQAGASELGIIPYTREEILWLRKLREPERAEFWSRAVDSIQSLSRERRAEIELRDLPIIVSASLHDPELLNMTVEELYGRVDAYVSGQRHHTQDSNYDGFASGLRERLYEVKDKLTWGDLAAMLIAIRAVQVPEVVDHLFDYAARDRADESTEYGGVIQLDARDRFEVREFPPVMRHHDNKFIASQAMLDLAYTSIFHFHLHVQNIRNTRYAGPGFGDLNYADNTRANCLVFTSIGDDTLNVDYYRHNRVVVDLGEVKRRNVETSKRPN